MLTHFLTFLLLQTAYTIYWIPYAVAGYLIVPTLVWYGLKQEKKTGQWPWMNYSPAYNHTYKGLPKWAKYWDNQGDSILGPPNYYPGKSALYSAYKFNVVKNAVNGMRFIEPFNLIIKPANVRWVGSHGDYHPDNDQLMFDIQTNHYDSKDNSFWCFTWTTDNPFKAGLLIQFKKPFSNERMKFQGGWKVYPKDMNGFTIPYRASGAGNAVWVLRTLR